MKTFDDIIDCLSSASESSIHEKICDGSFDTCIAGMRHTSGCDQGSKMHLEGDVAKHTAKVVSHLRKESAGDGNLCFDGIDLFAALLHDIDKTTTRQEDDQGNVTFPGHEGRAADRVSEISRKLMLTGEQTKKLDFLVREHGVAHSLPREAPEVQMRIVSSAYWRNLRLLQKADALSCYLNADGSRHLPVHWNLFDKLRNRI